MAQNIEIQYGSIVIGTTSSSMYIDTFSEVHSYRKYEINVSILITGTSDADFVANIAAIESGLEKDNQTLTVKFGPSGSQETHRNFVPSNFTGLNVRTSLRKNGGDLDTDRSRVYSWNCSMDLPADSSDDNYRESATWSLSFDASSRMTLSFSGTYTAGYPSSTATKATGNYLDGTNGVDSWVSTIFTDLNTLYSSITIQLTDFELIDEKVNARDDDHHLMDFSRTYSQRLFPDTSSGNHASIIGASVSFSRSSTNRHGNKQKGPVTVNVTYSCSVDSENTTYTGLAALWTGSIKPWIVAQAKSRWSGNMLAIESENTDLDVSGNSISSRLSILIFGGTAGILSEDVTLGLIYDERKTFLDIWDGSPHSYSVFSPGLLLTGSARSVVKSLNGVARNPSVPPDPAIVGNSGGWVTTSIDQSIESEWVGEDHDGGAGSVAKQITTTTWNANYRWVGESKAVILPTAGAGGKIISGARTAGVGTKKARGN